MLDRIDHDGILELRLARPPVNALNLELLTALRDAIESAPDTGAKALVLSGRPGVFTAGLDLPWLIARDIDVVEATWTAFGGVCRALAASPLMSAAAIGGYSPAGGAVISLYCDYRVMARSPAGDDPAAARGPYRIGLNEVAVGLFVPEAIQHALCRLVGPHRAERLMVAGAMPSAEEAFAIGMVDELVPGEGVVDAAIGWLNAMLSMPQSAQRETRRIARRDLIESISDPARMDLLRFIRGWQSDETQAVLRTVLARLGKG
ncbi:enoyl-CoA hydratase/isomerase family protein [Xanthomonadaceae bacterium XH05]|nr:enoyl-CoA hydratase/isomerase family protein [Xanthomonadaceae bacterium XH05]